MLLVVSRCNRQVVARCCPRARELGVREGMTPAHARAAAGRALLREHDPRRDRVALRRAAAWAARYSPIVAIDPDPPRNDAQPDGLILDATGCSHLFGGIAPMADALRRDFAGLGFSARTGFGPTIGAAWALAHFGPAPRRESLSQTLAPLPVAALRLDAPLCFALHELGLETIGHLLRLPRESLPSRFGPLLTRRLDQALGHAVETLIPVRPAPALRLARAFSGPTTRPEAVEGAARELLRELCAELLRRERGLLALDAKFTRAGFLGARTERITHRLRLGRPSRDPAHLWSLLRPHLERLHMGFGVEGVALHAVRTATIRHVQSRVESIAPGAPDEAEHGHAASELVDSLANRLGAERVLRVEAVPAHQPRRAFRRRAAVDAPPDQREQAPIVERLALMHRPTILLPSPEPAQAVALFPDHPPARLRWRGGDSRVLAGIGPERIAAAWWTLPHAPSPRAPRRAVAQRSLAYAALDPGYVELPPAHLAPPREPRVPSCLRVADFYRVLLESGLWVWVARDGESGAWSVHGLWA